MNDQEFAPEDDEPAEDTEAADVDPHAPYRTVDPEQGPNPSIA